MKFGLNEIHIWSVDLTKILAFAMRNSAILSADEHHRAQRFHFLTHQQRFIGAHVVLRMLLSDYLGIPPAEIHFTKTTQGKPQISHSGNELKFNLSHSADFAIYAFTLKHEIGVDIEKTGKDYRPALVEKYFTPQENNDLLQLPPEERTAGFYRIWSRKEALIKAIGGGLAHSLNSFSVSPNKDYEIITIENIIWHIQSVLIHPEYQSAVACSQPIDQVKHWEFVEF